MTTDQLDMFAMLDTDTRAHREATEGIASLFPLRCARPAGYEQAFDDWCEQYGRFASIRQSHAWRPEITADTSTTDTCQAAILDADLDCPHYDPGCECVGGRLHRGACRGCDWHGPHRADDDAALADALDHTHPGWRTLPVVDEAPFSDGSPSSRARSARWTEAVTEAYGLQGPGCPVITDREYPGTRSVPGRSPWGGYDVAASTLTALADRTSAEL